MKPKQAAIFLDRDGTIIEEVGYLKSTKRIRLIPRAAESIKMLKNFGFKIVVVSNQSGVARGYFDESIVRIVNEEIIKIFLENDAPIDAIYYCPHHPQYGLEKDRHCDCRKPKTGMLFKAVNDLNIDLNKSVIIGDKRTDVETGNNLGITSILVLTGFGKHEYAKIISEGKPKPDYVVENIYKAAQYIQKNFKLNS